MTFEKWNILMNREKLIILVFLMYAKASNTNLLSKILQCLFELKSLLAAMWMLGCEPRSSKISVLKNTQCSWPLSHLLSFLIPPAHTHLLTTSIFHYGFGLTYLSVVTWMFSSELSSEQLLVLSTLVITCLCTSLADYMRMILRPYRYKYIDGSLITCPFHKILEVFTVSLKVHRLVTSQIIGLWPNL